MGILTVLVGPSGSGKTTYAKACDDAYHMSSDELRAELYGNAEWQYSNHYLRVNGYSYGDVAKMTSVEKKKACNILLFKELDSRTKKLLTEGKDVIYDATSLTVKDRKGIIDKFKDYAEKIVCVYMMTCKEDCKKRNAQRSRVVPESVIDAQFERFETPKKTEGFYATIGIPNN